MVFGTQEVKTARVIPKVVPTTEPDNPKLLLATSSRLKPPELKFTSALCTWALLKRETGSLQCLWSNYRQSILLWVAVSSVT